MRTTEPLIKTAVLEQLLGNESFISFVKTPSPDVNKPLESEVYKSELAKVKADTAKNKGFLIGLYESLKLGDINEAEYRELKSTYESRMASLAESENDLRVKIQNSIRLELATEKARNSTVSVRTAADLTAEVVEQTVNRIVVYEKERIDVTLCFGADVIDNERGA